MMFAFIFKCKYSYFVRNQFTTKEEMTELTYRAKMTTEGLAHWDRLPFSPSPLVKWDHFSQDGGIRQAAV